MICIIFQPHWEASMAGTGILGSGRTCGRFKMEVPQECTKVRDGIMRGRSDSFVSFYLSQFFSGSIYLRSFHLSVLMLFLSNPPEFPTQPAPGLCRRGRGAFGAEVWVMRVYSQAPEWQSAGTAGSQLT